MASPFTCWYCSNTLTNVILPMSRREECAHCGHDQHVCKMCVFFSKNRCDEDRAEHISDTERANFCDYFKPDTANNSQPKTTTPQDAEDALSAWFSEQPTKEAPINQTLTPSEIAEQKLRKLLNG